MFGKHNIPKPSWENSAEKQNSGSSKGWEETMANVPTFDEHIAEKAAESEKNPLNLESLRNVIGFSEQLGKMGANQEILSNPAFERVLDGVLNESGLKFGVDLEGHNNPDRSELSLSCLRDKNRFLGSSQHDCSNFRINVRKNGNFTIDYAYVDREKLTVNRDAFANAKLPPNTETVNSYNDINSASRLEFVKHENSSGFNLEIVNLYENQLAPAADSKNLKVGTYFKNASESTRSFNAEGVETSRSNINYEPEEFQDANFLFTFTKPTDNWKEHTPSRASFNGLEMFIGDRYSSSNKVESVTHYSRNPDGDTVKISGHDREGEFSSDSVPLNTQYGASDIIVSNGVNIEDLRSASAE